MTSEDKAEGKASGAADEPPLDEVTRQLLVEQKRAEARKAIAEARAAEQKARVPDLSFEVPQRALDVPESGSVVAELLGYGLLPVVADRVAAAVSDSAGERSRVLVVDDLDLLGTDAVYTTIDVQLTALSAAAETLLAALPDPPDSPQLDGEGDDEVAVVGVVGAALSAVPGVLSLLRSNYKVTARAFDVGFAPVAAAVADALRARSTGVRVAAFTPTPTAAVLERADALQAQREALEQRRLWSQARGISGPAAEIAAHAERLAALRERRDETTDEAAVAELDGKIAAVSAGLEQLRADQAAASYQVERAATLVAAIDSFLTAAVTTTAGQTHPPLLGAALVEGLHTERSPLTHVLYLEVSAAGGQSTYKEQWGGDRAAHLGGVVVTFLLVDRDGDLVASGVESALTVATHKMSDTRVCLGDDQSLVRGPRR